MHRGSQGGEPSASGLVWGRSLGRPGLAKGVVSIGEEEGKEGLV